MDAEDSRDDHWTERARTRLPYVIGVLGLIAWFVLLYFMLRDAM